MRNSMVAACAELPCLFSFCNLADVMFFPVISTIAHYSTDPTGNSGFHAFIAIPVIQTG